MSTTDRPIKTIATEKSEQDTLVSYVPAPTTHQKYSSDSSISSRSKSTGTCSPVGDIHSNPSLDISPCLNSQQSTPVSVASAIAKMLEDMGVQYAFGVSGGAIGSATAPWAIASGGGFRIARL
jgi:acetolactate synthase-1/2/3 large subunit